MKKQLKKIPPTQLKGPRSYFTDIDPNDGNFIERDALRKLKLQLLTKERILIAASSMFHDVGYHIFSKDEGLVQTLEEGIIVPTIRNQFVDIEHFFQAKTSYSSQSKQFFSNHTSYSVPWDLAENVTWFKEHFFRALFDSNSVLRKTGGITETEAQQIRSNLEGLINNMPREQQFLNREHIHTVSLNHPKRISDFLINYANLIYRLSGARAVNSEGHFPQSNLTNLELVGNDKILSDENIFWDIYVETVISFIGSAIQLTEERLDRLSFKDILNIRTTLFESSFSGLYDRLIMLAKKEITIDDPEKLILQTHEIANVALHLRNIFKDRVQKELALRDAGKRENALWQVANILSLISNPAMGILVGALSTLKSIPEITSPFSPKLTHSLDNRFKFIHEFINSKIGWSSSQKKSFLSAYAELASYGLSK